MKKLNVFILKSYLWPFVMTFFICIFILLMQFLWRYIEDLVGKGLDFFTVSQLMFYIAISLIPMALPLAILLASLMTFGNLGENYELIAMKSAGISLSRIMRPLVMVTMLISIGAFYLSNDLIPHANLKMRSLLYDIQRKKPEFQIMEGVFYTDIEGYSIKISHKDHETNLLYGLKIYDHTEGRGNVALTTADSGYMRMTEDETKLLITLYSGYNYLEEKEEVRNLKNRRLPHRKDKFAMQEIALDLSGFGLHRTDENLFRNNYRMMNTGQLRTEIDSLHSMMKRYQDTTMKEIDKVNYIKSMYAPVGEQGRSSLLGLDTLVDQDLYTSSLFTSLKLQQQKRSVRHAQYAARRAKEYFLMNTENMIREKKNVVRYENELHRKFTLSFACFIFFFIGAPLGAIIRKGGFGMPIVISIVFFIFYYIISLFGEKMAKELTISPFWGMWYPSFILLPLGVWLTYKAASDAPVLNMDTYMNYLKKKMTWIQQYLASRKQQAGHS